MPSSSPSLITWACEIIQELSPKSVLDVGCGNGKWGVLAKEYSPGCLVTAIEAWEPYLTNGFQEYVYDCINVIDANSYSFEETFDLIILGDVLEHFERIAGEKFLAYCFANAKHILIMLPIFPAPQGAENNNPYERHLSEWGPGDFKAIKSKIEKGMQGYLCQGLV